MAAKNKFIRLFFVFISMLLFSCNTPRTLYLKNSTDHTISLQVDKDTMYHKESTEAKFKDSLNGRQLQKGHIIINFGAGKWTKSDQESLKTILRKITVVKRGNTDSFRLQKDIPVRHIGSFVNELVVTINQPKNK